MNSIWWHVAGWTMIHFLWIGSLVFLVTAILRLALFRAAPQLRYAVSLLGLAMLAFSPPMIAWRLASDMEPVMPTTEPVAVVAPESSVIPLIDPISPAKISEPTVIDLKYTPFEAPAMEEPLEPAGPEPVVTVSPPIAPTPASIAPTFDPLSVFHTLPRYLPWLWMIGTPATLLLLATGLMGTDRLRQRAEPITDPALQATLARLTAALRLSRRVTVAMSDRVLQPVLVGIVRPLILLPSVALTSWSPAEIEMALLHELAHVRRWDNLVNLVQRLVESLLFFHPAVWITSRWVRADREHCCDAVVVAHCGNREAYANLLVSVAKSSMSGRLPSHAMAMTSHPLARRVRRILQLEDDPMLVSKRTLLSVAVLLAALTGGAVWSSTLAEETKGEPEASVSGEAAPGAEVSVDANVKEETTESTEDAENSDKREALDSFHRGLEATLNAKGEPEASAPGVKEGTAEDAEDSAKELVVVTDFNDTETTKTFNYDESTPFYKIKQVIEKFEKAGHKVKLTKSGNHLQIVVTRGTNTQDAEKSPDDKWPIVFEKGMSRLAMQSQVAELTRRGKKCTVNMQQLIYVVYEGVAVGGDRVAIYPDRIVASEGKETVELQVTPRDALAANNLPFLSLEDQRIADLAFKMLDAEITQASPEDLAAAKEKGFAGGVRVLLDETDSSVGYAEQARLLPDDLLVGLHVWPTKDFDGLAEVLRRNDLSEFNPLKFYVLRKVERDGPAAPSPFGVTPEKKRVTEYILVTGRLRFHPEAWQAEQMRRSHAIFSAEDPFSLAAESEPAIGSKQQIGQQSGLNGSEASDDLFAEDFQTPAATTPTEGADSGSNFAQIAPGVAIPMGSTEEQKRQAIDSLKPQLLYDGRTFDDWRTEWKTELKTENRTEAIKALRAFGRAGYGKEATEAILEVAEEYPMTSISDTSSPSAALQTAIAYSFADIDDSTPIPSDIALPVILDWYDKGEANRVRLAQWVLAASFSKEKTVVERVHALGDKPEMTQPVLQHLMRSDPAIENDLTRQALKRSLESHEPRIIVSTISQLLPARMIADGGGGFDIKYELKNLPASLPSLLFHKDPQVRQYARRALIHASPEQLDNLPELLMGIVEQPGEAVEFDGASIVEKTSDTKVQKARKLDALRALTAIGPNAESIGERLMVAFEKGDDDTRAFVDWAIQHVFRKWRSDGTFESTIPKLYYERMKKTMESRPIESTFDLPKESAELLPPNQNGGGFGGDFGGGGMF